MNLRWSALALALVVGLPLVPRAPAFASDSACGVGINKITCVKNVDEAKAFVDSAPSLGLEFKVEQMCDSQDACAREGCMVDGEGGHWYRIYSRRVGSSDAWQLRGQFCLPFSRSAEFGLIRPEQIWREVRELEWPPATLEIQPPEGRTLVNLETNFYTEDTQDHSVRVRILGVVIEVEVHPVGYVWHAGDGTTWETEGPGSPYPDLDVTHVYTSTGTFAPSVDVVYSGRYHFQGEWHDFPETHTVSGESVELQVVQARPELVSPGT